LFLDTLIDAPKTLWHPRIVIIDEAHIFAPEKGMGESEASGSVIDLATRGRKRGLCSLLATQRLSKLAKNATAELLNRLVGPTFEDLDLDRAADLLSVSRGDREPFFKEMKTLPPGVFYGLGRAISKERLRIEIGSIQTTHPEMGTVGYVHAPTPTPEKIKALLDKLEGIPKIAEERQKTEDLLRAEVTKLKHELANRPTVAVASGDAPAQVEKVEVPVIKGAELARLEVALDRVERMGIKLESAAGMLRSFVEAMRDEVQDVQRAGKSGGRPQRVEAAPAPKKEIQEIVEDTDDEPPQEAEGLTNPQKAVLRGMREFRDQGVIYIPRPQLAGWLGMKVSGSFLNNVSALKNKGLIDNYTAGGGEKCVLLTQDGCREAPEPMIQANPQAVFEHVREGVTNPQKAILDVCKERYPKWIKRDELANALGLQISGSFVNNLGELHGVMLIEYGYGEYKNHVKLMDWTIMATVSGVSNG
jgi:hypothetical protein